MAVHNFKVGEYVKFMDKKGELVFGLIVKRNRKTVSVDASTGVKWRVGPDLLQASSPEEYAEAPKGFALREYGGTRR